MLIKVKHTLPFLFLSLIGCGSNWKDDADDWVDNSSPLVVEKCTEYNGYYYYVVSDGDNKIDNTDSDAYSTGFRLRTRDRFDVGDEIKFSLKEPASSSIEDELEKLKKEVKSLRDDFNATVVVLPENK